MQVIPLSAKLLGYSGVLPFAVLAVLHFQQEQQIELVALKGFIAYGAIAVIAFHGIMISSLTLG
jgi:hypothetical protein